MDLLKKFISGLKKTKTQLTTEFRRIATRSPKLTEDDIEELEEVLLRSDMGLTVTERVIDAVRHKYESGGGQTGDVLEVARSEVVACLGEGKSHLAKSNGLTVTSLVGVNGAGKTTTFNMVVGIVRPDEGDVLFEQEEITDLPMHERARAGIGYLTQEPSVFRKLTVKENILAILETCDIGTAERQLRLKSLLDELDLSSLSDSKAYQLSGGEKRRLEITRALVTNPKLLLLDEPFAGIDPIAVYEVQKIVRRLRERGLGILITDHNVRETLKMVDRAYLIHQGRVILEGDAEKLVEDPKAREIYLGPEFNI